jgi:putative DNA primase/helicase
MDALAPDVTKSRPRVRRITAEAEDANVGRNGLCPCGSGLKFKKCCLKRTPRTGPFSRRRLSLRSPRRGALGSLENVPQELRDSPHWMGHREEVKPDGKISRAPRSPHTGKKADFTDPQNHGTFEQALQACKKFGFHGTGYAVTADSPFTLIDLDGCIDPQTGDIEEEEFRTIVEAIPSYWERSPGDGLRGIVMSKLPPGKTQHVRKLQPSGKHPKREIGFFDDRHYFSITGDHLPGTPAEIRDCSAELRLTYDKVFSANGNRPSKLENKPNNCAATPSNPIPSKGQQILIQSLRADPAAARLWDGHWEGDYGSQSEADLALTSIIANRITRDPAKVDALFRQSDLIRPKWDEEHSGDGRTYGQMTIGKACAKSQPDSRPHLTDVGNGRRLAEQCYQGLRYVARLGWFCWDRQRWRFDDRGEVERLAKGLVERLYREAEQVGNETERREIRHHALKSESASRIAAIVNDHAKTYFLERRPDGNSSLAKAGGKKSHDAK